MWKEAGNCNFYDNCPCRNLSAFLSREVSFKLTGINAPSMTPGPFRNLREFLGNHMMHVTDCGRFFSILWQLRKAEIWQQILQFFSGSNLCPYSRQILSVCLRACYIFCFAVGDRFRCVLHAELCLIFCFSHYFLKERKWDSFNNGQLSNKDIIFFL